MEQCFYPCISDVFDLDQGDRLRRSVDFIAVGTRANPWSGRQQE